MGISVRHYLFPTNGEPQRLSQRLVDALIAGEDSILEYAGSRQRIMSVVLASEDGKPERIVSTDGSIWIFDEAGKIDEGFQDAMRHAMDALPPFHGNSGKIVSIGHELSRKHLAANYRWEPGQSEIDRVVADIWPIKGQPLLKSAKGTASKKPLLTWEAGRTLDEATDSFWKIAQAIEKLKARSLKGFVFECRQRIAAEPEYSSLFRALAEKGENQLEILGRRQSGKGVWYASIDVTRWKDQIGETLVSYHERCTGRAAAVLAARRLLTQHADKFAEDTTVEAQIVTDLEWSNTAKRSIDVSE